MPPPWDFQPILFYQNLRTMSRFAQLLIRLPVALLHKRLTLGGIVASLALYPRPEGTGLYGCFPVK
jgi:hypothetical protein